MATYLHNLWKNIESVAIVDETLAKTIYRGDEMNIAIRNFYIDNRSVFLTALVATALLLAAAVVLFPWRADLQSLVVDGQTQKLDFTRFAAMCAGIATIVGGAFALWRWTVDQRWRRVQYAQQLLEEFFEKENTKLALRMLDVQGKTKLPSASSESGFQVIVLTEQIFIDSLRTLKEQQRFGEPHFTIRMIFDEFFTDLSMFQHHIDANLIKLKDVRPYLEYWVKSINGYGRIYTVELAEQMNKFLEYFDYAAVLRLSRLLGYPLKAS